MKDRDRQAALARALEGVELLDLTAAARLMRGRGRKPVHVQTVRRWCNPRKGYRAVRGGPVAVLQAVRLGGRLLTTVEWVAAFEARRLLLGATPGP